MCFLFILRNVLRMQIRTYFYHYATWIVYQEPILGESWGLSHLWFGNGSIVGTPDATRLNWRFRSLVMDVVETISANSTQRNAV